LFFVLFVDETNNCPEFTIENLLTLDEFLVEVARLDFPRSQ